MPLTSRTNLIIAALAMMVVVTASNILVQYPINDLLTWGAFTYPVAFLVTDLTNRKLGAKQARCVVYVGFALAVLLSIYLADPRIAVASGTAFLTAQLLDVAVFDRLRQRKWWMPPLVSSLIGSVVDTALFFSIAFAGIPGDDVVLLGVGMTWWVALAIGDFGVKLLIALLMLLPFGAYVRFNQPVSTPEVH